MDTKKYEQIIQSDNMMIIGTRNGNPESWLRVHIARCGHQWRHNYFHWLPHWQHEHLSVSAPFAVFSNLSAHRHIAHTHRDSSHMSCLCSWSEWLASTLLSPFTSRTSCRTPSISSRTWSSWTTCCALRTKRVWTCLTSPTPTLNTLHRHPSATRWMRAIGAMSLQAPVRSLPSRRLFAHDLPDAFPMCGFFFAVNRANQRLMFQRNSVIECVSTQWHRKLKWKLCSCAWTHFFFFEESWGCG